MMAAILIFALVLMSIYATWTAIIKGRMLGERVAATVQRSRIAMRTLEDAFLTVQMFAENMRYYAFVADSSGDMSAVSMVSHLPASFPGVGRYGDQIVRRVEFYTQPGTNGTSELVMSQAPILLATNDTGATPYTLVLARDVSLFMLEFWNPVKQEWTPEWVNTNLMPRLVRISLGQGKRAGAGSEPQDVVSRIVALPTTIVNGMQAAGPPPNPNLPPGGGGALQPGAGGQLPPGTGGQYPPGTGGQFPPGTGGQFPPGGRERFPPGGGGIRR